jgi:galactose mutarotase-like enzyme
MTSLARGDDGAEAWSYVLTATDGESERGDFFISSESLETAGDEPFSVRRETLHGGKQEGSELITISTNQLQITIVPTRGMSVLSVQAGEVWLGWDSPIDEIVHPAYINLDSRGGLGWIEGFNELLVRCGLEFAGHPGTDVFTTNTGDQGEMDLTLHGKIGNIPASRVELSIEQAPPHRITVSGLVSERVFFGPKLDMQTALSVTPGESAWTITDTITNDGASEQEFEIIYHTNFGTNESGAGLLGEGSRVAVPTRSVTPMNAHSAGNLADWTTYAGPTPGFIEDVYLLDPIANDEGQSLAALVNAGSTASVTMRWSMEELPYFTLWKNTTALEDGYVTGLEPGTCYPYNRRVERSAGRLPVLLAGESRSFTVNFSVQQDAAGVRAVLDEIADLQGDAEPELVPEAPVIPE